MTNFKAGRRGRGTPYWLASVTLAAVAIILPAYAIHKASESIEPQYIAIYFSLIAAFTVYAYWSDKRKAKAGSWRTPESKGMSQPLLKLRGGFRLSSLV